MNDKIFRIDFYPKDWLLDTATLPPHERGVYIQLLMLMYAKGGPIENDPKWIAGVSGCSSRMARSIVDNLVEKSFIVLTSDGKITQKRAESELKIKRNFLETSAKGGRNSAERKAQSKENNNLTSSGDLFPVGTSSPTPPQPNPQDKLPTPVTDPPRNQGSFKPSVFGGGEFHIEHLLTDREREDAKAASRGWDFYNLCRIYDDGIASGKRERPKHPGRAFIAWIPLYTKGKQP